jgi:hypothetical protein
VRLTSAASLTEIARLADEADLRLLKMIQARA